MHHWHGSKCQSGTVHFTRPSVFTGSSGDKAEPIPESLTDLVSTDWFSALFMIVNHWYQEKYGKANVERNDVSLKGFTIIDGVPISLRIPAVTSRVETPGKTAWVTFQVGVDPAEEPLEWIVDVPDLTRFDPRTIRRLRREIADTASDLRLLGCALSGTGSNDATLRGLLDTVRASIDYAARIGGSGRPEELGKGYWELQMACECAMKAVNQAKRATFRETHDLFVLFNDIVEFGPSVERSNLLAFPRQEEVMDLRYGQRAAGARRTYLRTFRKAVAFTGHVLQPIVVLKLAGSSMLLSRPPWFKHIDLQEAG